MPENAKLRAKNVELETLADKDALTGAYNRQFLQSTAKKILASEIRAKRSWGVLMIDIDFFKNVNDVYGHPFGDKVLGNVTEMLQHISRSGDFVVRYGGEEFCILVWDIGTEKELVELAERYRLAAVSTTTTKGAESVSVTVSVGACFVPSDSTMEMEHVIVHADEALYVAKDRGRNRVEIFVDRRKSSQDRRKVG